jgi:hypothetical protein
MQFSRQIVRCRTGGAIQKALLGTSSSAAPPSLVNIKFGAKRPGIEATPERKPWPVSTRNNFFALQGEGEATTKATLASNQTSKDALTALIADLNDLKLQNPGMTIEEKDTKEMILRLTNRSDVSPFRVILQGEDELGFESSSSPGMVRTYKRNEFGEWNCTRDGHNLHGLLVRDLLPYIKGMPRFALK